MALLKLSGFGESLHGRAGNAVYVRTPSGTSLRDYVRPRDPKTTAQMLARERMAKCAAAWRSLSLAQAEAWRQYAQSLATPVPGSHVSNAPRAQALFNGLACRFLTMNPDGVIPLDPPAYTFLGDAVVVTVSAEANALKFTASTGNQPYTVTELLVQRLTSAANRPQARAYRSKGFAAFRPESRDYVVPEAPGWYASAYRFGDVRTGQMSPLIPLEPVLVPA